ncbi:MAG: VWA domain-containing protein [Oscillospiraceae bacterium]|nr:VWA domain-containing protein [Oscillospiraceae bacterium]
MPEHGVYLEKLSAFSRILRSEGLSVSPKETADAAELMTVLDLENREQVKTALRTVYAKSRDEQICFDRCFDSFFLSEEAMRKLAKEQIEKEQEIAQKREAADRELEQIPVELPEEYKNAYAGMAEKERNSLQRFVERIKDSMERQPELYANFIRSVFARFTMEQYMLSEDAGIGCEGLDPELGLMYRDISEFKETEMPKAIDMIRNIAQRINGELSAKRKNTGHSGLLDFRRTIRKGLETGGTFNRLRYKKKRHRRKHLVLLCDVSGSMVQFSEFALRFIQSLNQVSESSRTFLFSENLFEADAFSLQNMDLFRNYVRQSGVYGKGTDLGTALEKLCAMQPAALNSATTLLILSDTKTIDQARAVAALKEAKRLAGRVIWLNPIPESKWQYIRSVQTMASICTMVSCNTLSALASACRKLAGV